MRSSFDFAPYRRSSIGFDHLFDLLENTTRLDHADGYPPYDLEQSGEDTFRISLAVAGFARDEIEITSKPNLLIVSGRKNSDDGRSYLHRGIAARAFERQFQLADYVQVTGASLNNGLLKIDLNRELPEEVKPRKIEIGSEVAVPQQIESNTTRKVA